MSLNLFLILFCFQISINFHGISGSALVTCKPCVEVLNTCNYCSLRSECLDCALKINTSCYNCLNDIFSYGQHTFNCDSTVLYQKLACNYYCKPNKPFGTCSTGTGICIC